MKTGVAGGGDSNQHYVTLRPHSAGATHNAMPRGLTFESRTQKGIQRMGRTEINFDETEWIERTRRRIYSLTLIIEVPGRTRTKRAQHLNQTERGKRVLEERCRV
jgi:hypothetical protein